MLQNKLSDMALTFKQEISQLPVRNLSVLDLKISPAGHVYGAMVLELLRLCTSVQKLKVTLNRSQVVNRVLFIDLFNLNQLL